MSPDFDKHFTIDEYVEVSCDIFIYFIAFDDCKIGNWIALIFLCYECQMSLVSEGL